MSEDDERRLFEEALAQRELRELPADWKEGVLGNALVGGEDEAVAASALDLGLMELWARLFPKPVWLPLAAAWLAVLGLWLTMPRGDDAGVVSWPSVAASSVEDVREERLVAWVEARRRLSGMGDGLYVELPLELE